MLIPSSQQQILAISCPFFTSILDSGSIQVQSLIDHSSFYHWLNKSNQLHSFFYPQYIPIKFNTKSIPRSLCHFLLKMLCLYGKFARYFAYFWFGFCASIFDFKPKKSNIYTIFTSLFIPKFNPNLLAKLCCLFIFHIIHSKIDTISMFIYIFNIKWIYLSSMRILHNIIFDNLIHLLYVYSIPSLPS